VDSQVEVYSQPRGGKSPAYRERCDSNPKESVPLLIEGHEVALVAVQALLP
jgi:hypothetical protein